MTRAVIFANGLLNRWPVGLQLSRGHDWIIAADGGTGHCVAWGVTPHVIIGDMDSANQADLALFKAQGVEIIPYPSRKDHTDLQLAVNLAVERDFGEIIVLAGLGARWDMSLSNVLIMASSTLKNHRVKLVEENQEIFCLHGGCKAVLHGRPGDILSLMPLSQTVTGITLAGLEYPLDRATLSLGTTLGISNVFTKRSARIALQTGCLLITVIHSKDPQPGKEAA